MKPIHFYTKLFCGLLTLSLCVWLIPASSASTSFEKAADASLAYAPPPLASIGDFVWEDLNGNGRQDIGEPGINDVQVELRGAGADAFFGTLDDIFLVLTTANHPTLSGVTGYYRFEDLVPGLYYVRVDLPPGYAPTYPNATEDSLDSDLSVFSIRTPVLIVVDGAQHLDLDLGLSQRAVVGNRVWIDDNLDGRQDGGEFGLAGVTVIISDTLLTGTPTFSDTTTTDIGGNYMFTNIPEGDYHICFVPPPGYQLVMPNAVADSEDSDASPITGCTDLYTLLNGDLVDHIDAGFMSIPLSVQLVSFEAHRTNCTIYLDWSAVNSEGGGYFEIERSIDGTNFEPIAKVDALEVEEGLGNYTIADQPVMTSEIPVFYYRLKIVEADESYNYSSTVAMTTNKACWQELSTDGLHIAPIYPNPVASDAIQLNVQMAASNDATQLVLYDALGRLLRTTPLQLEVGWNNLIIDIDDLNAGIYFIRIESKQSTSTTQRFVKTQ